MVPPGSLAPSNISHFSDYSVLLREKMAAVSNDSRGRALERPGGGWRKAIIYDGSGCHFTAGCGRQGIMPAQCVTPTSTFIDSNYLLDIKWFRWPTMEA